MSKSTITVSKSDLAAMIAQAVAAALGNAKAEAKVVANTLVDGKTERQLKTDVAVCRAFKKAGYGEVKPREDVMTYNRWLANGYKVKTGEKSVKVKQFRLFHKSQVEFVGQPNKADLQAEIDAHMGAARAAKTTVHGTVSA